MDRYFGYKDTAGHWLRKDSGRWGKGGSIPSPSDWDRLKELLRFPPIYDKWLKEVHLTLQTVRPHPRGRNPGDVWSINLQPLSLPHFAPFPEELVERSIKLGCPPNGVVLDPFAGSGTVGKVARKLGRKAILIEIEEFERRYFDFILWIYDKVLRHPNSSPIGADMLYETADAFLHIDVKTSVITNTADYKGVVNIGQNQTSLIHIIHKQGDKPIYAILLICIPCLHPDRSQAEITRIDERKHRLPIHFRMGEDF